MPPSQEEADVDGAFAHDDGFRVSIETAVNVDTIIAGAKPGERAHHRACELIVWSPSADRFTDRERKQFADAHWRGERERCRTARGDGMEIERHANANHTHSFCRSSRSRLPSGSIVLHRMSHFANVPVEALVDALEKHVAKMKEAELAELLAGAVATMPDGGVRALVSSVFDAFRDRGESSEDAAEGANAPLQSLETGDRTAAAALVRYAQENHGLLKEALEFFAQHHADQVHVLPKSLVDGITQRL